MGSGNVRPIVQVGQPVLAKVCEPVTAFDADLAALIEDMFASMYAAQGVGLAANQIGVDLSVFIYDCPDGQGVHQVGVVCNPVLEELSAGRRRLDEDDEGCLSVKGQYAELARPDCAVVTGQDAQGKPIRVEGTGLLARCLQHETDHLNGMLFIDRLSAKGRKKVLKAWEKEHGGAAEI